MTVVVETGAPASVPSLGVTVHRTLSPPMNAPDSVEPVPTEVVPINHSTVLRSKSASGSLKAVQLHVRVSVALGRLGVMESPETVGGAFEIVRLGEAAAVPSVVPSLGVVTH